MVWRYLRRRVLAVFLLLGYGGFVMLLVWQVHGGTSEGWKELIKTYSALFFDLLILFLLSVVFLLVRGYYSEEATRIDTSLVPMPDFFLPLHAPSVVIELDESHFFERHSAVKAILDALPLDQSDFFLAHAGSLDIPKLTLLSLERSACDSIKLRLGVGSFREFFFTHHFADYHLSRSSSKGFGTIETLRSLFQPVYERFYMSFFRQSVSKLDLLDYTPNTLGVTGCVRVVCGNERAYFFQRRGHYESAARGVLQLTYAGTLNALPAYVRQTHQLTLDMLANDEFEDEFWMAPPGEKIRIGSSANYTVEHELVGVCANSQYLFQPELFVLTTITVQAPSLISELLQMYAPEKGNRYWAMTSLEMLPGNLSKANVRLRPLCQTAIDTVYRKRLMGERLVADKGVEVEGVGLSAVNAL